jgi:hypothetical protein
MAKWSGLTLGSWRGWPQQGACPRASFVTSVANLAAYACVSMASPAGKDWLHAVSMYPKEDASYTQAAHWFADFTRLAERFAEKKSFSCTKAKTFLAWKVVPKLWTCLIALFPNTLPVKTQRPGLQRKTNIWN